MKIDFGHCDDKSIYKSYKNDIIQFLIYNNYIGNGSKY